MFLDASIIVAILAEEDDCQDLKARLLAIKEPFYFSPVVRYEAVTALARITSSPKGGRLDVDALLRAEVVFDYFMAALSASEIDISVEIGKGAIVANGTYGKTAGHRAALNFGDCFSYATAKALGVGLLYKGNDFALTDLG